MRNNRLALLTGAAAIILAGYAGIALAGSPETHVLTLRLPDGQMEQVRYEGNVPPTVILAPDKMAASSEPADPFAMLEQISARMDRQAEALFRAIDAMGTAGGAGFATIPALSGPFATIGAVGTKGVHA